MISGIEVANAAFNFRITFLGKSTRLIPEVYFWSIRNLFPLIYPAAIQIM